MSYAVWPANLQQLPLVDGFSSTGEAALRRQQMESGLDRVTLVSDTVVRANTYSVICTREQLADFWSFYNNEANKGADFVLMPMVTGNDVQFHTCRFIGYPTQIPDGLEWRVTFQLETDEQQINWSL